MHAAATGEVVLAYGLTAVPQPLFRAVCDRCRNVTRDTFWAGVKGQMWPENVDRTDAWY